MMKNKYGIAAATLAAAFLGVVLLGACTNGGSVITTTGDGTTTTGDPYNPGQEPTGIKAPEDLWGWWYSTEGVPLTLSGQNFKRYQSFYVSEDRVYAALSTEYQARASGSVPHKYYAYRSYSAAAGKLVTDTVSVVRVSDGKGGWVADQVRITYMNNNSVMSYDALRVTERGGFSGTANKLSSAARSIDGARPISAAAGASLILTNILNQSQTVTVSANGSGVFTTLTGPPLNLGDPYYLSIAGQTGSVTVFASYNGQNIGLAAVPDAGAGYTYTYKASYLPGRRLEDPNIRCINLQVLKSGSGSPKKLKVAFSCPDNTVRFEGWSNTPIPDSYTYPLAGYTSVPDLISYELFFDVSGKTGILEFPVHVVVQDDKDGDGNYDTTWLDEFVAKVGTEIYTVFLTSNMDRNIDSVYINDYMLNGIVFPSAENPLKGTITSLNGLTTSYQASYLNYGTNQYVWAEGPGDPYRFVVHSSKDAKYSIGIDALPDVWTLATTSAYDPPGISLISADNGPDNPVVIVPGSRSTFFIKKGEFHFFTIDVNPGAVGSIAPPDFSLTDTKVSGPLSLSMSAPAGTPAGAVIKYALVWQGTDYFRSGKDDSIVYNFLTYQYDPPSAYIFDPASPITNEGRSSAITISAWIEVPDGRQSPRSVKKFTTYAPKPTATLVKSTDTGASYLSLADTPLATADISFLDNFSGSSLFTPYEGGVNWEVLAAESVNNAASLKMTETDRQNRLTDRAIKGFLVRMMPDGATAGTMQVWAKAKREVTRTVAGTEMTYTAYEESDVAHFTVTSDGSGGWTLVSE